MASSHTRLAARLQAILAMADSSGGGVPWRPASTSARCSSNRAPSSSVAMSAIFHCRPWSSDSSLGADLALAHVGHGVLERALRGADAHGRVAAPLVVDVGQQRLEPAVVGGVAGHEHVAGLDAHAVEGELGLGAAPQPHLLVRAGHAHAVAGQVDHHGADALARPGLAAGEPAPHQTGHGLVAAGDVVLVGVEPPPVAVGGEMGPHGGGGRAGVGLGDADAEELPGRGLGQPPGSQGVVAEVLDGTGGPLNTSWHKIALDTSTRAISSRTMAASTSPMPMPPYSSPTVTVNSSARRRASSEASANSSVSSQPGAWGAMSRSATSRASLRSAARSSSSTRSIALTGEPSPPARARAGGVRTPDLTPSSVNLLHWPFVIPGPPTCGHRR